MGLLNRPTRTYTLGTEEISKKGTSNEGTFGHFGVGHNRYNPCNLPTKVRQRSGKTSHQVTVTWSTTRVFLTKVSFCTVHFSS